MSAAIISLSMLMFLLIEGHPPFEAQHNHSVVRFEPSIPVTSTRTLEETSDSSPEFCER